MIIRITSLPTNNLVEIGKEKIAVPKYEAGIVADCPIGETTTEKLKEMHDTVDKCIWAKEESDLKDLVKTVEEDNNKVGLVLLFNEAIRKDLDVKNGRVTLEARKILSMLGLSEKFLKELGETSVNSD